MEGPRRQARNFPLRGALRGAHNGTAAGEFRGAFRPLPHHYKNFVADLFPEKFLRAKPPASVPGQRTETPPPPGWSPNPLTSLSNSAPRWMMTKCLSAKRQASQVPHIATSDSCYPCPRDLHGRNRWLYASGSCTAQRAVATDYAHQRCRTGSVRVGRDLG